MADIQEKSIEKIITSHLESFVASVDEIHISFDIDAIDPQYAPGVSTPEEGGMTKQEALLTLKFLAQTGKVKSLDLVEVNPKNDYEEKTAKLAVEFIMVALSSTA